MFLSEDKQPKTSILLGTFNLIYVIPSEKLSLSQIYSSLP